MNFIEVTIKGGNKALINIKEISDVIDTTSDIIDPTEDGKCVICIKNPETYYTTQESYEEIKMKLLRFAEIG